MDNLKWTKLTDNEFRKKMFSTAEEILDMVLSTSGSEEGLNVVMTIMATFACSMNDNNWRLMINSAMSGIVNGDGSESEMEQAIQIFWSSFNKIRRLAQINQSKYINKCNMKTGEKKDEEFPEFPGRGPGLKI